MNSIHFHQNDTKSPMLKFARERGENLVEKTCILTKKYLGGSRSHITGSDRAVVFFCKKLVNTLMNKFRKNQNLPVHIFFVIKY